MCVLFGEESNSDKNASKLDKLASYDLDQNPN